MSRWPWVVVLAVFGPLVLAACSDDIEPGGGWTNVCIDLDRDGYGLQCALGSDCDDSNAAIHEGCAKCATPEQGCPCEEGTKAVECRVTPEVTGSGTLLCKEGTRYCRDGAWSGCEGISSFAAPPPEEILSTLGAKVQALIAADAAVSCDLCAPNCYDIQDPIKGGDAGAGGMDSGVAYTSTGSITLPGGNTDAGRDPDQVDPPQPCDMTVDKDCDGIPDALDPYPADKPFESDHQTIFMNLAPAESGSSTFDLKFFLKTADLYFLLDMTGSMADEKDKLLDSLKSGNFLDDPSTPGVDESNDIECADVNFDGVADNYLKTRGLTGNIACLIRSAGFGTGLYREIPYNSTDIYGISYAGSPDLEMFEHRLDINTTDTAVDAVANSLKSFTTRGNRNNAESGNAALHAVATGGPIYVGWDRPGVPQRTCPSGKFGYPCFRNDAMPIVVLITDAPLMNGPTPDQGHLGQTNNAAGNKYNAQPVNYEARGLAYTWLSSDSKYYPIQGGDTYADAPVLTGFNNTFKTYTGDFRASNGDYNTSNLPMTCSSFPASNVSAASYPDVVYKFTSTDPNAKISMSTRGSRVKTAIAVFPVSNNTITVADNPTVATARDLGTLTANGRVIINGNTTASSFDSGELSSASLTEFLRGKTVNATAPDAYYKFTVPQDLNNVTFTSSASWNPIMALFAGSVPPAPTQVSLTSRVNNTFLEAASALGGTALVPTAIDGQAFWVSDGSTSKSGITADFAAGKFNPGGCSVSGLAKDAVIDFSVTGTRTVRLETTSPTSVLGAPSFDTALGLFPRPLLNVANGIGNASVCNRAGAGSNRAFIETTLTTGIYSAIVRDNGTSSGTYGLMISDVTTRPQAVSMDTQTFTTNLKAGVQYFLVVRGQQVGRGTYTVTVTGENNFQTCAYNNATYTAKSDPDENPSPYATGNTDIVDQTFPVGDYYVVLKSRGDIDTEITDQLKVTAADQIGKNWYSFTIGDRNLSTPNTTGVIPQWGTAASGTMKELLDRGIRVIVAASAKPKSGYAGSSANAVLALQQQADIVSRTTKAITSTQTTRDFDFYNDGSGVGYSVVSAIAKLTNNVAMDVSVRLVPLPDTPSKPFGFVARAIPVSGNLCGAPVDTNGDNIKDTFKGCAPGAVPRFEITITNPAIPNNVPPNPAAGSKGGYNMRIEMIADSKYVIDTTPVYVVPSAVPVKPPVFQYDVSGTYTQDIAAACTGTDRPTWKSLTWNDTLLADTGLEWKLCGADSASELATQCPLGGSNYVTAANVAAGAACTSSATCLNGYCAGNICHYPLSPSSTCNALTVGADPTQCGADSTGGNCLSTGQCACTLGSQCAWKSNSISVEPSLKAGQNSKRILRVAVTLKASTDRSRAPIVHDFKLRYVCAPGV